MKRNFINKMIVGTVISTTLFTLVPSKASAEWVNDYQGNWYYMQENQRLTGWKKIDGQVYYFDSNGRMQKGWIKAGDSWYYLQNNGALKYGWINYSKNWYYSDSSGAIQTGVLNIAGKVYAFDDNGILKTRNVVINGEFYTIGLDGEVVGAKVPTPDKEYDETGKLIKYLTTADKKVVGTPTDSTFYQVPEDKTWNDADPNEGRTFKVTFRDSNGAELKSEDVKYGESIDLYTPTKFANIFSKWNTKVDGSGKDYDDSDSIKVDKDITLYAQWTKDNSIFVDGITIKGGSYVTVNKTTQMTAQVSPDDAANKAVKWSVTNGTGKATIDSNGLLTGVSAGTVTVKATSEDGSNISASKEVTVSTTDVVVPVTQISLSSATGTYKISTNGGTLQMKASVIPSDATSQDVTWSIVDGGTGSASINPTTGLVTAISNGTIVVKASAQDSSGVSATRTITITGQTTTVPVTGISVSGKTGSTITTDSGTLQMVATVAPSSATNKTVTWSVDPAPTNGGKASIDPKTGMLTAVSDGDVIVTATSTANSSIAGTAKISISGQTTKAESIDVTSSTGSYVLDGDGSSLQMSAAVSPTGADSTVTWTVVPDPDPTKAGKASIDSNGKLTPVANGIVKVKATSKKSPTISGTSQDIEIKNISIKPTSITITAPNSIYEINAQDYIGLNPDIQLGVDLAPANVTKTNVSDFNWTVQKFTGDGLFVDSVNQPGLLRGVKNGTVSATATSIDAPNISSKPTLITIKGYLADITNTATIVGNNQETQITNNQGTLKMNFYTNSSDTTSVTGVTWSVISNGDAEAATDSTITGKATMDSSTGILTAVANGKVRVKAVIGFTVVGFDSNTNTVVKTDKTITLTKDIDISGQLIKVSGISISSTDINNHVTAGGTLQMAAAITPSDASNKTITWSVEPDTSAGATQGQASIGTDGKLTATTAGTIVVRATANDGSGIYSTTIVTIYP